MTKTGTRGERSRPNHRKQRNGGDDLGAMRAVGVACARWAWRQRENCSVNSFFREKKQRINAKSEPSKCSRLAISRRRQSYAMIGVELRTLGEIWSNLEDGSAHLHTSRIVVKIPKMTMSDGVLPGGFTLHGTCWLEGTYFCSSVRRR